MPVGEAQALASFAQQSDDYRDYYTTAEEAKGSPRQTSRSPPTKQEKLHMKPTNNFEDITEEEFDRRERAKAEYRRQLQEQMNDQLERKENSKKQLAISELQQEKRIYRQLQDMQQEYINDELKKGNADVRVKVRPIDMLPPIDEADAVSAMDRRKERSKSKSKSPTSRLLGKSDSQRQLSRVEI